MTEEQPEPSIRTVMLMLAAHRTIIETLLEIMHRHHRDDLQHYLLTARGLYLNYRDHGAPDDQAQMVVETVLELLESAIGDPDENLLTED